MNRTTADTSEFTEHRIQRGHMRSTRATMPGPLRRSSSCTASRITFASTMLSPRSLPPRDAASLPSTS